MRAGGKLVKGPTAKRFDKGVGKSVPREKPSRRQGQDRFYEKSPDAISLAACRVASLTYITSLERR
ncbi:hypothetical protein FRZ61_45810 [Hypericibacter adhaerens]|uniref:Uncharacterized protein n=1 Tax=Hypericibacter adhaerens TaxID=2602016 RepID=A0A5J6N793_9PROT|nr:hypothetical protein FRZ61_45810 [Hypericibacter adhaerens]